VRLPSASLFFFRRSALSSAVCSSQSLDHVVPQARLGCNSYRNLVSSCIGCNSQKGEKSADDFLRRLYRKGHLHATELAAASAPSTLSPPASSVLPSTGETRLAPPEVLSTSRAGESWFFFLPIRIIRGIHITRATRSIRVFDRRRE